LTHNHRTALLVIDAQVGLLDGAHRSSQTVSRIADLVDRARAREAPVVYMQHDGDPGGRLEVGSPGWLIHPDLSPRDTDLVIRKRASDSFHETSLLDELRARRVTSVVVTGLRTEACVDTTSRRAVSLDFDVLLAADAHTTSDSDVLTAAQIVAHTNHTLDDFGTDAHVVTVLPAAEIDFPT
jgi:nicotinamidase-related amidase